MAVKLDSITDTTAKMHFWTYCDHI